MVINRAIAVSHECDSGGREIGEKLAQKLGVPFCDKELIATIAEEGNIEASVLGTNDEVDPNLDSYSPRQAPPDYQVAVTQRIYAAQATVTRSLSDRGPYVTVERCADTIPLDAVSTFVFVDMESHINRIISLNPGLAREGAKASILAMDKKHRAYRGCYSTTQQGDMSVYDVYLNSGLAGVEGYLETALTYVKCVR